VIHIASLHYSVGAFRLSDIHLQVGAGQYCVLLGRPGSGKTLLLECVAGLRRVESGTIEIAGERVEWAEPRKRGIGYVPQDYALFSRMSVRDNIAFGLAMHRVGRAKTNARIEELAAMLDIEPLLSRGPQGLSGGERQRVALARALAPRPRVLLLDEPVNALDPETRDDVLAELVRIQHETGTTTVHVCHDLDEMRAVADVVGIIHHGRLIRAGAPGELAADPQTEQVAKIMRLGTVLTTTARETDGGSVIDIGGAAVACQRAPAGEVKVVIRASAIRLRAPDGAGLVGEVASVLRRDSTSRIDVRLGSATLRAEAPVEVGRVVPSEPGTPIGVEIPADAVIILAPHAS